MKFYVKNKFLSWGGSSEVLNENKEPIYKVKGKVFSITHKKYICDMEDNRLFMVRNKYWHFFIGTIKRELNFIVNSFEVNVENPENAPFMIAFVIAIDNIVDRASR